MQTADFLCAAVPQGRAGQKVTRTGLPNSVVSIFRSVVQCHKRPAMCLFSSMMALEPR